MVSHDGALFHCRRREFPGRSSASTKERKIDARKRILLEFFHLQRFSSKLELLACRSSRSEKLQVADRKIAFFKQLYEFSADRTGSACHCEIETVRHGKGLNLACKNRSRYGNEQLVTYFKFICSRKRKMSTLKIRIHAKHQMLHLLPAHSVILSFPF